MDGASTRRVDPPWMAEWRRRKAAGLTGVTGHLKYGKFSRAVVKSLELQRPPLSDLDAGELDRLEAKYDSARTGLGQ